MSGPGFGLVIPQRGMFLGLGSLPDLLEYGARADESGLFSSVWVGDSLTSKPRPDSLTSLGSLAGMTRTVRLGVACMASFPVRDSAVFAYQWATLDHLSGGRMWLAVCNGLVAGGASAREAGHWGLRDVDRPARMEEAIDVCRRLWSGKPVTFEGRHFRCHDLTILPAPVQDPCPVLIAANPWDERFIDRALRRVATLADGWMTSNSWPGLFSLLWSRLQGHLAAAGRDPRRFPIVLYHNVNVGASRAACLEESSRFLDAYYGSAFSPPMVEAWTAAGSPADCAGQLAGLAAQGPTHLALRITSWRQDEQYRRLVEEVLPMVGDASAAAPRNEGLTGRWPGV